MSIILTLRKLFFTETKFHAFIQMFSACIILRDYCVHLEKYYQKVS